MVKIVKATEDEKRTYRATKPTYPLYGFVEISGQRCEIEDLRSWAKGNPQYEVMAPDGYIHEPESLHTLLCFDYADIRGRIGTLERCSCQDQCSQYWKEQSK